MARMKKKQAVQTSLEQMEIAQSRLDREKELEEAKKRKDNARPSLLKRVGASLLDFIFAALLAASLFAFSYFVIFPSTGYNKSTENIILAYEDSGLFYLENGQYEQLTSHYNEDVSPEKNYDVPITNFYKTNTRAIKDNMLEDYNNRKIASGCFELNEENELVRKHGVTDPTMKDYLEDEYKIAIRYFLRDPQMVYDYNNIKLTMFFSLFAVTTISSLFFYVLIPLIDKKKRTFGYMIAKLVPVMSNDFSLPKDSAIILRSIMFIVITYISTITIYFWLGGIAFASIPFFLNTVILSFSRTNSGLHDYATKINVINESHSNAFQNLTAITGDGCKR